LGTGDEPQREFQPNHRVSFARNGDSRKVNRIIRKGLKKKKEKKTSIWKGREMVILRKKTPPRKGSRWLVPLLAIKSVGVG